MKNTVSPRFDVNPQQKKIQMTDDLWSMVESLEWNKSVTTPRYYEQSNKLFIKFTEKEQESIETFVRDRVDELTREVETYERLYGQLSFGSDDGRSDVLCHVVGLGKQEYLDVMKNPWFLQKRYHSNDYQENFLYTFQ
jgi:hypothetical protein